MKVTKILPLVHKTSDILSLPEELVAQIVSHQFSTFKESLLANSPNSSGIILEQIGKFRPNLASTNRQIRLLIPLLRTNPTPKLIDEFRYYWTLRQDAIKEKTLRNYKKRYGSWHN